MKSEEELAQELYDHRDDPGEWSEEAVEIKSRPKGTEVVSFRLPSDELDKLEEAAAATGESLSEFIRKALAMRMRHVPAGVTQLTYKDQDFISFVLSDDFIDAKMKASPSALLLPFLSHVRAYIRYQGGGLIRYQGGELTSPIEESGEPEEASHEQVAAG